MLIHLEMKKIFYIFFIITLSILLCNIKEAPADNENNKKGLKVTVLLFSGRPDPTFLLEDEDILNQLKDLLSKAKTNEKFEQATVIPSILGYKGIVVDNPYSVAGFPSRFAIYKGNIEIKDGETKFLIDEENKIEGLLLDRAIRKGVIDKRILKRMERREYK